MRRSTLVDQMVQLNENPSVTGRVHNTLQRYSGELTYQLGVATEGFGGNAYDYVVLVKVVGKDQKLANCLEDDVVDYRYSSDQNEGLAALRAMQQVVRDGGQDVKSESRTARAGVVELADGRRVVVGVDAQLRDLDDSQCERVMRWVVDKHLTGFVDEILSVLLGATADVSEPANAGTDSGVVASGG